MIDLKEDTVELDTYRVAPDRVRGYMARKGFFIL